MSIGHVCLLQELGAPQEASRCLQGLAALAALEQHHGQARALLEAAQRRGGPARFWGDSGLALATAALEQGGQGAPSAVRGHFTNSKNQR